MPVNLMSCAEKYERFSSPIIFNSKIFSRHYITLKLAIYDYRINLFSYDNEYKDEDQLDVNLYKWYQDHFSPKNCEELESDFFHVFWIK